MNSKCIPRPRQTQKSAAGTTPCRLPAGAVHGVAVSAAVGDVGGDEGRITTTDLQVASEATLKVSDEDLSDSFFEEVGQTLEFSGSTTKAKIRDLGNLVEPTSTDSRATACFRRLRLADALVFGSASSSASTSASS